MSKTMKACVYYGPNDLRIEDVPYPTIQKPDDAIVKVLKQGICGTDIHIAHGDMPEVASGRILGHEFIGEIAELGPAYIGKFKVGDKVAVSPITQCGGCFQCRNGEYSHCEMDGGWIFGYMINGCQAEYIRVPHANMAFYEIPEGVNDESAIFAMDALSTGFFGVENAFIKPGDVVAVMGCGPVGMGALATAKLYGPSCIVAVDSSDYRLSVALKEGVADVALNPTKVDVVEALKEITKGRGADCTIEAVGAKGTYDLALNAVRIGGNVSMVGVFAEPQELRINELWIKNINVRMGLVRCNKIPILLDLLQKKKVKIDFLATHQGPLNTIWEKGYDIQGNKKDGCFRYIVTPYEK